MRHFNPLPIVSNLKYPSAHVIQNWSLHPGGKVFGSLVVLFTAAVFTSLAVVGLVVSLVTVGSVGSLVTVGSVGANENMVVKHGSAGCLRSQSA